MQERTSSADSPSYQAKPWALPSLIPASRGMAITSNRSRKRCNAVRRDDYPVTNDFAVRTLRARFGEALDADREATSGYDKF